MVCNRVFACLGLLVLSLAVGPAITSGQPCDDFDECTDNDVCVVDPDLGSICAGTPIAGCPCDDGNDCTTNDRYIGGECMGDPIAAGTPCNGGCGNCQTVPFPGIPPMCTPNNAMNGQACSPGLFGLCSESPTCTFGSCGGTLRACPDADGNPCTPEFCNPETGQCQTLPECLPCETCSPGIGCVSAPLGTACDDFNECTAQSHCGQVEGFVFCMEGPPTVNTPTPTHTTAAGTATPTTTGTRTTAPSPTPTDMVTAVPTGTLTATSTFSPMATHTPTQGAGDTRTATHISTSTQTATPIDTPNRVCTGDCNNDSSVAINELITGVNIALANQSVEECPQFDANEDGEVAINELIAAVNNALFGCESPTP